MSMVSLPGLKTKSKKSAVSAPSSCRSIQRSGRCCKGYERYRRAQSLDKRHFDEEYFDNFEVELDVEEEGFRVLSTKTIVEEVSNSDHQISLREVQEVAAEAQLGDSVVLDVTPDQREFGRMAAMQTKQVLRKTARPATPNDSRGVPRPEGTVLQARYCGLKGNRCSWQSAVALVSRRWKPNYPSGNSCPTITIERMRRSRFISKSLPRPAAGSPTGSFQS